MRVTESISKELIQNKNVVIFGAGNCGEIALRGIQIWGGYESVCYCDSNARKQSKLGIRVMNTNELADMKDSIVVIATLNYFAEILNKCRELGINQVYDMEEIYRMDIPNEMLSYQAQDIFANKSRYFDIINHCMDVDRICLGKVEVCVSQICSLKCKDCSYLMPYYCSPQVIDYRECLDGITRLLDKVDYVAEIRLLGGEPFVNTNLYKIIDELIVNGKIGIIDIHTNGTIIPDDRTIISLQNENVIVHISDYDVNRNKCEELVNMFEASNIHYYVRKYDEWLQMGAMEEMGYSSPKLLEAFETCTSRNCFTLVSNKLFHCARSAHATTAGLIPDFQDDYIDLADESVTTAVVSDYFRNSRLLDACKYCRGGMNLEKVSAAIQGGFIK